MKVYLAARYSRHPELQGYARDLEQHGIEVTSRWIHGGHQITDEGLESKDDEHIALRRRFAMEDMADLREADLVISFTEPPRTLSNSRGGRHVEFGAAWALEKALWIVGPRENVFHCLLEVAQFDSWEDALSQLVLAVLVETPLHDLA